MEPGERPAVRFRHDRAREGILSGLEPGRRQALQLAMARRLASVPELSAVAAEEAAVGRVWNQAAVDRVQAALDRELAPISDHRGSAEYRKEAAKSLIEKFWWEREEAAA